MLISLERRLAYLALPKTGTSSLEAALEPHCDIRFGRSPRAKHMTLATFERFMLPYLRRIGVVPVETVCVVREPVDWLGSWYRYLAKSGGRKKGRLASTRNLSFAEFVEGYLADPQPPFARIGRPSRFVTGRSGRVTHLYRYEDLPKLVDFLGDRFGTRLDLPSLKVSPKSELALPPALRRRLETERAEEFELYASLG